MAKNKILFEHFADDLLYMATEQIKLSLGIPKPFNFLFDHMNENRAYYDNGKNLVVVDFSVRKNLI